MNTSLVTFRMFEEFKEDNVMPDEKGIKRNTEEDLSAETAYRTSDFFSVFGDLTKAFVSRDFPAIHTFLSVLYSITLHSNHPSAEEFNNSNIQQFFFDFFNDFECKDFFPEGLRVLNYILAIPDFECAILETEDFFNILITEVKPHIKYPSTTIEVIRNIIQDNPAARQNFLESEENNVDYFIDTYSESKDDILMRDAIVSVFNAIITTEPTLPIEAVGPILDFSLQSVNDAMNLDESDVALMLSIINTSSDYMMYVISKIDYHLIIVALINKTDECQALICDLLKRVTSVSPTLMNEHLSFASIISPLMYVENESIKVGLLELIEIFLEELPLSIYSAFEFLLFEHLMNYAMDGTYKIRYTCIRILSKTIIKNCAANVINALLAGGYFEAVVSFIESDLRDYIFKAFQEINSEILNDPRTVLFALVPDELRELLGCEDLDLTEDEIAILDQYETLVNGAIEIGLGPIRSTSDEIEPGTITGLFSNLSACQNQPYDTDTLNHVLHGYKLAFPESDDED